MVMVMDNNRSTKIIVTETIQTALIVTRMSLYSFIMITHRFKNLRFLGLSLPEILTFRV